MKWFERWFYKQSKKAWENKSRYEAEAEEVQMKKRARDMAGLQIGTAMVERSRPEGEGRISFELSSAPATIY